MLLINLFKVVELILKRKLITINNLDYMADLNQLEQQLNLLEKIDTSTLTIEECIDYCVAVIEVLDARLIHLLQFRNYRKAVIVESEIKVIKDQLKEALQIESGYTLGEINLKVFLEQQAGAYNYYRSLVNSSSQHYSDKTSVIHSIKGFENELRSLLFGHSYELKFDGLGFLILFNLLPGDSVESLEAKLKDFCKELDAVKLTSGNAYLTKNKDYDYSKFKDKAFYISIIDKKDIKNA